MCVSIYAFVCEYVSLCASVGVGNRVYVYMCEYHTGVCVFMCEFGYVFVCVCVFACRIRVDVFVCVRCE